MKKQSDRYSLCYYCKQKVHIDDLGGIKSPSDVFHSNCYIAVQALLSKLKTYEQGVEDERNRWINQPSNKHDKKIIKAYQDKLKEGVEGKIKEKPSMTIYELKSGYYHSGYKKALKDVKELIERV